MTHEEIETLGRDIAAGQVVGSWSVPSALAPMVFLPFALMDQEAVDQLKAKEVVHIYEYLDKAGPRSVNGWPSFMSFKCITKQDWEKLAVVLNELLTITKQRIDAAKAKDKEGT